MAKKRGGRGKKPPGYKKQSPEKELASLRRLIVIGVYRDVLNGIDENFDPSPKGKNISERTQALAAYARKAKARVK